MMTISGVRVKCSIDGVAIIVVIIIKGLVVLFFVRQFWCYTKITEETVLTAS